jgi:hypothetical protein
VFPYFSNVKYQYKDVLIHTSQFISYFLPLSNPSPKREGLSYLIIFYFPSPLGEGDGG